MRMTPVMLKIFSGVVGLCLCGPAFAGDEIEALKARVAQLEARIAELEIKSAHDAGSVQGDDDGAWDLLREMERMRGGFHSFFDQDSFSPGFGGARMPGLTPDMLFDDQFEIRDEGDTYVIVSDVPGMIKDSLQVEARGQMLIISGRRDEDVQEQEPGVFRQQKVFGTFSRSLPLPPDAVAEGMEVAYQDDVLTVRVKKRPGRS